MLGCHDAARPAPLAATAASTCESSTPARNAGRLRQYTDTVDGQDRSRATCFGQGTGGSGDKRQGQRLDRARRGRGRRWRRDADLRPALRHRCVRKGFGLGVCGIGGGQAPETELLVCSSEPRRVAGLRRASSRQPRRRRPVVPVPRGSRAAGGAVLVGPPARATPGGRPGPGLLIRRRGTRARLPGVGHRGKRSRPKPRDTTMVTELRRDQLARRRAPEHPGQSVKICVDGDLRLPGGARPRDRRQRKRATGSAALRGSDAITARGGDDEIDLSAGGPTTSIAAAGKDKVIRRPATRRTASRTNCEKVSGRDVDPPESVSAAGARRPRWRSPRRRGRRLRIRRGGLSSGGGDLTVTRDYGAEELLVRRPSRTRPSPTR